MANSKYEYVRAFEQQDNLLANTWIVVRIDGRGFSKFTTKYEFLKPNDKNGLDVMNAAAEAVMKELPDLVLAFGNSDEFSFVFHKDCALFERRASKLTTTIVSTFTSYYVYSWPQYFPDKPLTPPLPSFDGRAVCYPSDTNLRDYMSWRQVDCHINNLYNTTFWTLVQQGGMGAREAEQRLKGTVSADKNEILFKEFGINYNNEPECFKKGTVLYRDFFPTPPAEEAPTPTFASFPSPPLAQPTPQQPSAHRASLSIEKSIPFLQEHSELSEHPGLCRRPTFLSTTSTPSPPPSPSMVSRADFPNPLRCNPVDSRSSSYQSLPSMPLSPPVTGTPPWGNIKSSNGKTHLPSLTPLPLSPPTLKPSTKPPLSLNPPNTAASQDDFPADYPVAGYRHNTVSHSASASLPPQKLPWGLKHRSPSQPSLPTYSGSNSTPSGPPPSIPLRMSSIPANSKPRKLSLPVHRSTSTLKAIRRSSEEKEYVISPRDTTSTPPRKVSPPIRKNKALPSPPMSAEEEMRTREKVIGHSPHQGWESPQRRTSDSDNRGGHVWTADEVEHPGIAELPAVVSTRTQKGHSRLHSAPASAAPTSANLHYPHQSPDMQILSGPKPHPHPANQSMHSSHVLSGKATNVTIKPKAKQKQKQDKGKAPEKNNWAAERSNEGRPVQMSRTQKDKERKKRSKAAVLMEHVDIIKDDFWDKRPWILSGRAGV